MLTLVFNRMIELSLMGSFVAMLILGMKWLLKDKISPKWHYLIWFILLIKLVMPMDIESTFALIPRMVFLNQSEQALSVTIEDAVHYQKWSQEMNNVIIENDVVDPLKRSTRWFITPSLSLLWLSVVMGLMIFKGYREWLFYKKQGVLEELCNPMIDEMRDSLMNDLRLKRRVGIYIHKERMTPKVYGVIKPKIIISEDLLYSSDIYKLKYVLLHELCHVKQKDILINVLRNALMCIYFFNPLIVWSLKKMAIDCESSCDAMVLGKLNEKERLNYGYTLISLVNEKAQRSPSLALSLGRKKDIVRRIEMIKSYKDITMKSKIVGLVLAGILAGGCLFVPYASAGEIEEIVIDEVEKTELVASVAVEEEKESEEQDVQVELDFIKPLEKGTITSYYGERWSKFHDGIDLATTMGEDIFAAESGKVVYLDLEDTEYGKIIVLEHAGGIKTLYAQCEEVLVEIDQTVSQGDTIATVGMSGKSTGPHLHLGLIKDGDTIDPKTMMDWIE